MKRYIALLLSVLLICTSLFTVNIITAEEDSGDDQITETAEGSDEKETEEIIDTVSEEDDHLSDDQEENLPIDSIIDSSEELIVEVNSETETLEDTEISDKVPDETNVEPTDGTAYAVYLNNGDLIFFRSTGTYANGSVQTVRDIMGNYYNGTVYSGIETMNVSTGNNIPWYSNADSIYRVYVADGQTIKPVSFQYWFYYCTNLTDFNCAGFDASNITSMHAMFCGCSSLVSLDLSNFDISKVTKMSYMFQNCSSLTSLTLCGENNVPLSMEYMFNNCYSLTSLNVSGFSVLKVTNMAYMFNGCSSLTSLDLSNFITANVTNMSYMFNDCSSLLELNLSGFRTQNVTNMAYMFCNCSSLTSLDLSSFNTTLVGNMAYMFCNCSSLTSLNLNSFNTQVVENLTHMFQNCSSLTSLNLSGFRTFNSNEGTWVDNMSYMFSGCTSLTSLDLSSFDTYDVTDMSYMFNGCSSLISLNIGTFETSLVKNMTNMFYGCTILASVNLSLSFIRFWKSNAYLPSGYWKHATKNIIKTEVELYNSDGYQLNGTWNRLSNAYAILTPENDLIFFRSYENYSNGFDRSVIDIKGNTYTGTVYSGIESLNASSQADIPWYSKANTIKEAYVVDGQTINPVSFDYWFYGCANLMSFDGTDFNTTGVTSMKSMFSGCSSLTSLNVSNFNTANVTDTGMASMFYGCSSLTSVNLNSFNTSKITDMTYMFYDCASLSSLNLSLFNTAKVTDMSYMFYGCSSLSSLNISNFNTANVTSMSNMFKDCSSLTTLNFNNIETANVTDFSHMFDGCTLLSDLRLPIPYTLNVTDMSYMFNNCSSLTSLDLSGFNTSNVTNMTNMFSGCSSLNEVKIGSYFKWINNAYLRGEANTRWTNDSETLTASQLYSKYNANPQYYAGTWRMIVLYYTVTWKDYDGTVLEIDENVAEGTTPSYDGATPVRAADSNYIYTFKGWSPTPTAVTSNATYTAQYAKTDKWLSAFNYSVSGNTLTLTSFKSGSGSDITVKSTALVQDTSYSRVKLGTRLFYNNREIKNLSFIGPVIFPEDSSYLFAGANNTFVAFESISMPNVDTSNVTTMEYMFSRSSALKTLNLSAFNTSRVTDMSHMFWYTSLESINLNSFNTSNVTDMMHMFDYSRSLNALNLSNFNTGKVTSMYRMFNNCVALTTLDLSGFNTSSVVNMGEMFLNCTGLATLDLSSFNTSSVTNMASMFSGCSALTTVKLGTGFTKWINNAYLPSGTWRNFEKGLSKTQAELYSGYPANASAWAGSWYRGEITTATSITLNKSSLDMYVNQTETLIATILPEDAMIKTVSWSSSDPAIASVDENGLVTALQAGATVITATTIDGSNLTAQCQVNVDNVYASYILLNKSSLGLHLGNTQTLIATVLPNNTTNKAIVWSSSDDSVVSVNQNGLVTGIAYGTAIITATTTDGTNLSAHCTVTIGDIISTDGTAYAVLTDDGDFIFFRSFETYSNNVYTDVIDIFNNFYTGTVYSGIETLFLFASDNQPWKVKRTSVKKVYVAPDQTIRPKSMSMWFSDFTNLVDFDASGFDTSNVIYMDFMFSGCSSLTNLDLCHFDTSKVGTSLDGMRGMFKRCTSLISLDLSNFNTSNVDSTSDMFDRCSSLVSVKLGPRFTKWTHNAYLPTGTWYNEEKDLYKTATELYWNYPSNALNWSGTWIRLINSTSISLDKRSLELQVGETETLIATVLPENATNKNVSWSSSNDSIASVDQNGLVTALKAGTAIITAKTADGTNLSSSCTVTVIQKAESISLNKTSLELYVDQTETLIATVLPSDTSNKNVSWSSSDTAVASVDQNGLVTALKVGTAIITATTVDGSNLTAQCEVNIEEFGPTSGKAYGILTVDGDLIFFRSYETYTNGSSRTVTDIYGNTYSGTIFSGIETATYGGAPWFSYRTSIKNVYVADDQIIRPAYVESWFSSCNNLVSFDATGFDTSKVKSMRDMFFNCSSLTNLDLSYFDTSNVTSMLNMFRMCGKLVTLDLSGFDTSKVTSLGAMFLWCESLVSLDLSSFDTSNVTDMGTMFSACSFLASVKLGSGFTKWIDDSYLPTGNWINVEKNLIKSETELHDNYPSNALSWSGTWIRLINSTSISLDKRSLELQVGETETLIATVLPENATNKNVNWTSSDISVASVDQNGLVTALKAGTAVITAKTTDETNLSSSCTVTVIQKAESISLNKTSLELYVDQTETLIATVLPSDTSNKSVTWSSSNSSVASVSQNGLVTARKAGTAIITATTTDGTNLSSSCTVTVIQKAESISLNKTSLELYVDQTETLIATVLPSDTSNKNVNWSSSDPTIVSVDENGLLSAHQVGTAIITVKTTDGSNLSATCRVTVVEKEASGNAYALLKNNGDLIFFRSYETYTNMSSRTVTDIYGNTYSGTVFSGIEKTAAYSNVPWYSYRTSIKNVYVADDQIIKPISMFNWVYNCSNLVSFDATGFDTSKVTNMSYMFYNCSSLEYLDLSSFDTSGIDEMNAMFGNCTSLTTVKLGSGFTRWIGNAYLPSGKWTNEELGLTKTEIELYNQYPSYASRWYGTWTRNISQDYIRIYRESRLSESIKVADELKRVLGVEKFDNIIIAKDSDFADALSGSYLAARKNAPILLVNNNNHEEAYEYIEDNLSDYGTVYILGGNSAVSYDFEEEIDVDASFIRIAGSSRYMTNLDILNEAGMTSSGDIFVVTGTGYADSLSSASVGLPILMADNNSTTLKNSQKKFLAANVTGRIYILGDTPSVSAELEKQLKAYGPVTRIGGSSRWETTRLIAERFFPDPEYVTLATGNDFADGLIASPLAYALDSPLLMCASNKTTQAKNYVSARDITKAYIIGSKSNISDEAARKILVLDENTVILER